MYQINVFIFCLILFHFRECITCVPCPAKDEAYAKIDEACPHNGVALADCKHLCGMYQQDADARAIAAMARTLNEFAVCHINTIEYINHSVVVTPEATTTVPTSSVPTSPVTTSPVTTSPVTTTSIPPKQSKLSFSDAANAMLTVLCIAIFVLIIGALCRSGIRKKRREDLKKRQETDIEAEQMAVEITDNREPYCGVPVRRMSIGQDDVVMTGLFGCLAPRYPSLKQPRKKADVTRRHGDERSEDNEESGKLALFGWSAFTPRNTSRYMSFLRSALNFKWDHIE